MSRYQQAAASTVTALQLSNLHVSASPFFFLILIFLIVFNLLLIHSNINLTSRFYLNLSGLYSTVAPSAPCGLWQLAVYGLFLFILQPVKSS